MPLQLFLLTHFFVENSSKIPASNYCLPVVSISLHLIHFCSLIPVGLGQDLQDLPSEQDLEGNSRTMRNVRQKKLNDDDDDVYAMHAHLLLLVPGHLVDYPHELLHLVDSSPPKPVQGDLPPSSSPSLLGVDVEADAPSRGEGLTQQCQASHGVSQVGQHLGGESANSTAGEGTAQQSDNKLEGKGKNREKGM